MIMTQSNEVKPWLRGHVVSCACTDTEKYFLKVYVCICKDSLRRSSVVIIPYLYGLISAVVNMYAIWYISNALFFYNPWYKDMIYLKSTSRTILKLQIKLWNVTFPFYHRIRSYKQQQDVFYFGKDDFDLYKKLKVPLSFFSKTMKVTKKYDTIFHVMRLYVYGKIIYKNQRR